MITGYHVDFYLKSNEYAICAAIAEASNVDVDTVVNRIFRNGLRDWRFSTLKLLTPPEVLSHKEGAIELKQAQAGH